MIAIIFLFIGFVFLTSTICIIPKIKECYARFQMEYTQVDVVVSDVITVRHDESTGYDGRITSYIPIYTYTTESGNEIQVRSMIYKLKKPQIGEICSIYLSNRDTNQYCDKISDIFVLPIVLAVLSAVFLLAGLVSFCVGI